MGTRYTRASQSPLHSETEALIWEIECMRNLRQFTVTFATDYTQMVKMVSETEEWPAFASYLEDIKFLRRSFNSWEIILILRTQNSRADSLARSVRKESSFVVYMDTELLVWFTKSVWVCYVADKNKNKKTYVKPKMNSNGLTKHITFSFRSSIEKIKITLSRHNEEKERNMTIQPNFAQTIF